MASTLQTIQDFIDDLRIDNTPGTVDVQSEGLRAINFILQDMQSRHDWEFTQLDHTFRYYSGIHQYSLPSAFKGVRSVYPAATFFDDFRMVEPTVFKRLVRANHPESLLAIERAGIKRLHCYFPRTTAESTVVSTNSAYDGDGTWVASNDAANVRTDTGVFHENDGCVSFDIDVSASVGNAATISKTKSSTVDLSSYVDGRLFMWVYISSNTNISSFTLRWGNTNLVYHEHTVTTQFDGAYFENGWNLLGFDFEGATDTGTPDDTAIDYLEFSVTYAAAMADLKNVRIGELTAKTYEDMILKYYSYDMVLDVSASTNVRKFDGTDTADQFLFPDEMESVVQNGAAWTLLRQMGDPEEAERCRVTYEGPNGDGGLLKRFMDQYPSKLKKPEPPQLFVG